MMLANDLKTYYDEVRLTMKFAATWTVPRTSKIVCF